MKKAVITVVGKDTVGILAKTCTYLAENGINILDISQTVVQDYFNMMMIVDMSGASRPFGDVAERVCEGGRVARPPGEVPEGRDLREDAPDLSF